MRDDKGNPVAAATVQAHAADGDERAETGADGAFRFVTFAAGAQPTIFAYAVGYSMATRSCKAPAAGIVVVLSRTASCGEPSKTPQPETLTPVFSAGWGTPRRSSGMVWTMAQEKFGSEDGSFELRVQPGTGAVTVSAPGYQDSSVGGIVVAAGETRDGVVCSLHPGSRLAGRVIDDSGGAPVSAATVSWFPPAASAWAIPCDGTRKVRRQRIRTAASSSPAFRREKRSRCKRPTSRTRQPRSTSRRAAPPG